MCCRTDPRIVFFLFFLVLISMYFVMASTKRMLRNFPNIRGPFVASLSSRDKCIHLTDHSGGVITWTFSVKNKQHEKHAEKKMALFIT